MTDGGVDAFDHLRPADDDDRTGGGVSDGIYRVVGTGAERVTLLRVADADGRRGHTGEVVTVSRDALAAFAPTENPDADPSVVERAATRLDGVRWSLRLLWRAVAARPLAGGTAVALVLVGAFGAGRVPLPDAAMSALVVAGGLALAYLAHRGPS
ncbi:hypothetical protein [Haloarcula salina]|uniref:Uncharacterized protein n=1 Tax=Haloarcula salina TaxID=1429914 RepID=A0AA41KL37_9EURY|nr:hypothetical protein [Haloarcula salina]MBV0902484.1 hypothetical protein [Haloarcula salina]